MPRDLAQVSHKNSCFCADPGLSGEDQPQVLAATCSIGRTAKRSPAAKRKEKRQERECVAVRGKEERTAGGSKRGSSPHKKRGSNTHTELRTTTDTTAAYLFATPNCTPWYASSLPLPANKERSDSVVFAFVLCLCSRSFFFFSVHLSLFPFWFLHPSSTLSVHHLPPKRGTKACQANNMV